jgi:hypothetical protein
MACSAAIPGILFCHEWKLAWRVWIWYYFPASGASHKFNPSSVLQGYVDSYSTLPWVTWEAVTDMVVYPVEGYCDTHWLTGLLYSQAKVEGIVLKAEWHWGCDCSVLKDPLGELGRTSFYVGLPSAWGSVDGDQMFSSFFVGRFLNWGLWRI